MHEHIPAAQAMARRRITEPSHRRFAAFSGDLNPLHVDAEAARTMEPGGLLAYGMDLLLWALESLAEAGRLANETSRVRTRFLKWVFLEDEIELLPVQSARAMVERFDVGVKGATVMTVELFAGARQAASASASACESPCVTARRREPRNTPRTELQGQTGDAALAPASEASELYPALAARLGPAMVCEMAGCSYVIGMEAPGLYSMSVRYDLTFCGAAASAAPDLQYTVIAADPRFRNVTIAVQGAHLTGTLEALVRTV